MCFPLSELKQSQHFTQPPAHYTEASLVKAMEGAGYWTSEYLCADDPPPFWPDVTLPKKNKNLYMTELGEAVNGIMKKCFPSIVDLSFTANMELLLDKVADGTVKWKTIIENFYPDLDEAVATAEKTLESVKIADEVSGVICDVCGRNMVVKYGPHGKFLACPLGFPDCKNTKPYLEKTGVACPKCGKDIVIKRRKRADVITAVRIIRNVISCPGRNRPLRNARSAAAIW